MDKDMGQVNAAIRQMLSEGRWEDAVSTVKTYYAGSEAEAVLLQTIDDARRRHEASAPAANANMIFCKYCGKTISKTAKTCPHCGGRFKKPVYKRWWFIVIMVVVALCVLGSVFGSGDDSAPPAPQGTHQDGGDASSAPDKAEEPRVIPDPIVYTGTGDDVVQIDVIDDVWLLRVTGNSGARHFSVTGYDSSGEYAELFVNTTEPYSGVTFDPSQSSRTLEVNAEGDWTIEVISLALMDTIYGGETYSGDSDNVFLVYDYGATADISGNADAHHFAVKAYGGTTWDLLVNTTDPYDGTVMMKDSPFFIVVTAESPWSFTLSA